MTIKPWREVAHPTKTCWKAKSSKVSFAADILRKSTPEPRPRNTRTPRSFARTFITEGMRLLLQSVAERLSEPGR